MPPDRRPYDEDEDDFRDGRPPSRSGASPVLIVALILGSVLLVVVAGCAVLGFAFTRAVQVADEAVQAEAEARPDAAKGETKRVYTRQEFRELVMGKTPDEVIAAVGKPDRTADDDNSQVWRYDERTRDPVTGKADDNTHVYFENGKVTRVSY